jgi:hypothetical protein
MKILDIAFNDLTRSFRSAFAIGMMVFAPLLLTGTSTSLWHVWRNSA